VQPSFEILEHTADIGFRAWGANAVEVFESSACALMAIATEAIPAPAMDRLVDLAGWDYASLMVNWLSEILYLYDSGQFAASAFSVDSVSCTELHARIAGEPRDPVRHPWRVIVKAVTLHQIEVAEKNGRWEAQVFLDI
jgi:SHS2 domain-containing protein